MALLLVMKIIFFLLLIYGLAEAAIQPNSSCSNVCGNVSIPFPFGIGPNCYLHESFAINCSTNGIDGSPKAIISRINMEALEINVTGQVRAKSPIISSNCSNVETGPVGVNLLGYFYFSAKNIFTAVGCNNYATMTQIDPTIVGCVSGCNATCEMTIPSNLQIFNASVKSKTEQGGEGCKMAFLAEKAWFNNITDDSNYIQNMSYVPVVLDWAIFTGIEDSSAMRNLVVDTKKVFCHNSSYIGRFECECLSGYKGNPYISTGCQDINECDDPEHQWCPSSWNCKNTEGSFICNRQKSLMVIVGIIISTGLGVLVLLVVIWWLYKVIKKRKETKLKKKFFERNGGLLLQQQLSSSEDNIQNMKLFNSEELEKATDHFNESRILGQGGQGTVYKGMLVDGRIVAIKRSRVLDEANLEQFANEIVILSQVNHRNVVKLHGCCLETKVPLLVYEFIPNGTLFQYLHDQNEEFPLTWNVRLRIATEVAGALSYLHSSAALPIYHRDIKSTNILLDDKYRAKIADFGTSRSVAIDQTHLTTNVCGTFGYLDPEYFQTSQFTEKSDVYSFGVVLVELLTGEKPISSMGSQEVARGLASYFIFSVEENHLFDILDSRVINEGNKEDIMTVANLAKRCLNLSGKKRPTMREVTIELEGIQKDSNVQQNYEEFEYVRTKENDYWDVVSMRSDLESGNVSSSDVLPLLSFKTL